jgi:hypothetical protein
MPETKKLDSQKLAEWAAEETGKELLKESVYYLLYAVGVIEPSLTATDVRVLLEEFLMRLKARLDEDRLAKMYGAFSQLRDAERTAFRTEYLASALNAFHVVASLPRSGMTGGFDNRQLRCLAFLGMGAAHRLTNDSESLIAEKFARAVYADFQTSMKFLGEKTARALSGLLPNLENSSKN